MLQTNKATYNQDDCDATCILCGDDGETLSHFLLQCPALEETRRPILREVLARDDVQRHIRPNGVELSLDSTGGGTCFEIRKHTMAAEPCWDTSVRSTFTAVQETGVNPKPKKKRRIKT